MTSFQKRNTVQYSKSRLKLTFDDDFGGRTIASMIPVVHTIIILRAINTTKRNQATLINTFDQILYSSFATIQY